MKDLAGLLALLGDEVLSIVGPSDRLLTGVAPLDEATSDGEITFCTGRHPESAEKIAGTAAGVVLVPATLAAPVAGKTLLVVENPRLSFLRILRSIAHEARQVGVHPTAHVEPGARLGENVWVGPFCYVGECTIGDNTVLHGHVHVYGNGVRIGRNCNLYAHVTVGTDGFGYSRDEQGRPEMFPSIGGVVIEDEVDIHCYSNVDRGTLGDTVVGTGTKIDKYNHIGHNVRIGRYCLIKAQCVLAGGARVEDYATVGICVAVKNGGVRIGERAMVGMGAIVTRDVPPGETVAGNPARPLEEQKRIQEVLKQAAREGVI